MSNARFVRWWLLFWIAILILWILYPVDAQGQTTVTFGYRLTDDYTGNMKDATYAKGAPNTVQPANKLRWNGYINLRRTSAIRVTITDIPDNATITAASWNFYCTDSSAGQKMTKIHSMTNTPGTSWVETDSTWNEYNNTANLDWTNENGTIDDIATLCASLDMLGTTGWKTVPFNADGLTYLQGKIASGVCDFNVQVSNDDLNNTWSPQFGSSEYGTAAARLYLSITYTISITQTPTLTATPTETQTATLSPTLTATLTLSPTQTPTLSATQTLTISPTDTITLTATPTITATQTLTLSPTQTITNTPTPTVTNTPTVTITMTVTPTPTNPCHVVTFGNGSQDKNGISIEYVGSWEDTYADGELANKDTNYGTSGDLKIRNPIADSQYTHIRVNLTVLSDYISVLEARIWFYITGEENTGPMDCSIQAMGGTPGTNWTETGDTFNEYDNLLVGGDWTGNDGGNQDRVGNELGSTSWSKGIGWRHIEFNADGLEYLRLRASSDVCSFIVGIDPDFNAAPYGRIMASGDNVDTTIMPYIELFYCPIITQTPTATLTNTPTQTQTVTATNTPTQTATLTTTATVTQTQTAGADQGEIVPVDPHDGGFIDIH